jgi:hypothetical protein
MVANAAGVVDGEGEENDTLGVDFGNEIGVDPVNFAHVLVWCALERTGISGAGRPGAL